MSEDAPLPPVTNGAFTEALNALRSLEEQLRAAREARRIDAVVLRIGFLYGADVPSTRALLHQAKTGRLFAPRRMSGVGPFVHVDDAAAAIVAAIEHPRPSFVYNVADDQPMAFTTFLASMSRAIGAPPPRRLPAWLLRLAAPLLAEIGSARLELSNAKAKRELAWTLRCGRRR